MKVSKLIGERFKERPAECVVDSHALMIRGGYMKNMTNGIYASYLPLKRITQKIESIIREEMDRLEGQEVSMPVVLPASFWQMSGRYETVGKELLRFTDRTGAPLVLGMTHEEAAVMLVKDAAASYTKYPFMIYQIQTKFRDEARSRAGLIRVREFTMKDAYSFHTSMADLEAYYQRFLKAYHRIFERVGLPEVIDVASDSGMMGGQISHEFMLLTEIGEDSIAVCEDCGYHANVEAAPCFYEEDLTVNSQLPAKVYTGDAHTIEAVGKRLGIDNKQSCKAVVYEKTEDGQAVLVFIRGDLEVNESKLTRALGAEVLPASDDTLLAAHLVAGCIGPYQLETSAIVFYDQSLAGLKDICCGANEADYHYVHLNMARDLPDIVYGDYAKITDGSICPVCHHKHISIKRGIEVGNIFQLGDKYTKAMEMTYLDEKGKKQYPVMGCYGIGVGRLAASICEARHDAYGPIWPLSIAPWQVHICALKSNDPEVKQAADALYQALLDRQIEVIYDDRHVSAGVMFSDADLLGVPLRIIISPKTLKNKSCELKSRDHKIQKIVEIDKARQAVCEEIKKLTQLFM